jgi:hypothetical protein
MAAQSSMRWHATTTERSSVLLGAGTWPEAISAAQTSAFAGRNRAHAPAAASTAGRGDVATRTSSDKQRSKSGNGEHPPRPPSSGHRLFAHGCRADE